MPEAVEPVEAAFDHPAARQREKRLLCLGQFDDVKINALGSCGLGRVLPRIALIDKRDADRLAGYGLYLLASSPTCARSCSLTGVTCTANRCPNVSTAICTLLPTCACSRHSPHAGRSRWLIATCDRQESLHWVDPDAVGPRAISNTSHVLSPRNNSPVTSAVSADTPPRRKIVG